MINEQEKMAAAVSRTRDGKSETTIAKEYVKLRSRIIELYDERVWFMTDAAMTVHAACLLEDICNPVAMIFVDAPSTEKTTVLNFFADLPMNFRIDDFTAQSFVSQAATVRGANLHKVHLLPKLPYKTLTMTEMAPLFNQPKEVLLHTYGILSCILDGEGYSRSGGTHGFIELKGDYLFNLLGACTPLSQTAWNTMSKIGSRLIFLNAPAERSYDDREDRSMDIMNGTMHYRKKRRLAKEAVTWFMTFFFANIEPEDMSGYQLPDNIPPELNGLSEVRNHCGYLPRCISWDSREDNLEVRRCVARLATFATSGRSDLKVWEEKGEGDKVEINTTGVIREGVDRLTAIFKNVIRSHCMVRGGTGIDWEDLPLIVALAVSCLPDDRRKCIELMLKSGTGEVTTQEMIKSLNCHKKTATLIMKKIKILKIADFFELGGSDGNKLRFTSKYKWLTSEWFGECYRKWDDGYKDKESPDSFDLPF